MPGFYTDLYNGGNRSGSHTFDPELIGKVTLYDAVKEANVQDGELYTWRNKANGNVVCTFVVHVDGGKIKITIDQLIGFPNPTQNTLYQYEIVPFGRRP